MHLALPPLMLWAWQRPEDLRFIDARTTGVAYLAGTASITRTGSPWFEPRLQPLALPNATAALAVVRIERGPWQLADLDFLSDRLSQLAAAAHAHAVQVDFDAARSQRMLYRELLRRLHQESKIPVTITALQSWCDGDPWLPHTLVAEAVPMFFRMGAPELRDRSAGMAICGSSIGLSLDEKWPPRRPSSVKRIYLFNPRAWTAGTYKDAVSRIRTWK